MQIRFKLVAIAALLANSLGSAQAQNNPPESFYGGLEVGRSSVSDQTGSVSTQLVTLVGGRATATQGSSINDYRIFGGYKLNENINLELGYLQTSDLGLNFAGVARNATAYSGSSTLKFTGFDYSVLLRPNVSTGMNGLFLRLGGHSLSGAQAFTQTVAGGTVSGSSNQSGTGLLFGVGYDIGIAKNVDLRVSANRLNKIAGQSDSSATVYSVSVHSHGSDEPRDLTRIAATHLNVGSPTSPQ
jgi:hypothetical protein